MARSSRMRVCWSGQPWARVCIAANLWVPEIGPTPRELLIFVGQAAEPGRGVEGCGSRSSWRGTRGSGMAKVRCERPLIDRTGWSKSGAQVWAELRSTASNGPELHCRDRRILCFRRPRDFANQPGGQGVAGSNPVVPTARSAGQRTCASLVTITSPVCCPMDCPNGRR
jgi:hypothetical protein